MSVFRVVTVHRLASSRGGRRSGALHPTWRVRHDASTVARGRPRVSSSSASGGPRWMSPSDDLTGDGEPEAAVGNEVDG